MLRSLGVPQMETDFPIFRVTHITICRVLKYTEASKSQSSPLSSRVIIVGAQTLKSIAVKQRNVNRKTKLRGNAIIISCYMDISTLYDDTDDHSSDDKSVLSNISSLGRVLVYKIHVKFAILVEDLRLILCRVSIQFRFPQNAEYSSLTEQLHPLKRDCAEWRDI
jgi:ADP-dependent phosphofructokinase/glucokinase